MSLIQKGTLLQLKTFFQTLKSDWFKKLEIGRGEETYGHQFETNLK
jgi:hypothetical protein